MEDSLKFKSIVTVFETLHVREQDKIVRVCGWILNGLHIGDIDRFKENDIRMIGKYMLSALPYRKKQNDNIPYHVWMRAVANWRKIMPTIVGGTVHHCIRTCTFSTRTIGFLVYGNVSMDDMCKESYYRSTDTISVDGCDLLDMLLRDE